MGHQARKAGGGRSRGRRVLWRGVGMLFESEGCRSLGGGTAEASRSAPLWQVRSHRRRTRCQSGASGHRHRPGKGLGGDRGDDPGFEGCEALGGKGASPSGEQLKAILITAPENLRRELRGLSTIKLVRKTVRFRPG